MDAAVSRSDNPRTRMYVEDNVNPGTRLTRHIDVSNNTGRTQTVSVYAGPASIEDGVFVGAPAGTRSELGSWTSLGRDLLVLRQGERRRVRLRIAVPATASPGERYGVIWVAVSSRASSSGAVTMVNRVGVRIYLDIGPGGEPASDFSVSGITASRDESGTPVVRASVRNTGGRALDLSGRLLLSHGPGGLRAGPFRVRTPTTLAPGQRGAVSVTLDERVPDGPWKARMSLRSSLVRDAVPARITFPEAGASTSFSLQAPWWQRFPWLILLGVVLLVAPVWFVVRRRRHESRERLGPEPA